MFYDQFVELCKARGMSPAAVTREIGLNNSSPTAWKRGAIPNSKTLQKLADYFGVSTSSLIAPEYPSLPDDLAEVFLNRDIGPNLKDLRKAKGLTQKELSEKTGIPLAYIQSFERGTGGYFPTEDDLLRLAEVFRVGPKYIKGRGVTQEWMRSTMEQNKALQEAQLGVPTDDETTVIIPIEESFTASLGGRARATTRARINTALDQMTPEGQSRVADYVEDILPRYRASTAPESTPAPTEGQDTTPPPDAPETPPGEEWDRYGGDRYGGRRDE